MPFPPIGRKAKDLRDLKNANASGGQVTIRSKNKITNPSNPSQTLGRGSTVTVTQRPVITQDKPKVTPGAKSTTVTRTDSFVPGDMSENKRIDRPTTPELGKSFRENPAKTQQRIGAQAKKETSYTTPSGKKEYSGRIKSTYEAKTTKAPDTIEAGKIRMSMKKNVDVVPVAPDKPKASSKGRSGIIIHRSAGTNNQGKPQNYRSLEIGGRKVVKWRTPTRRSK